MQLTIERGALLKTLGHVQSVPERRNTIPILSNVLLRATDGGMELTASDMDLTINDRVAADVSRPGTATLPAHMLYDIVRKLPEGAQVEIGLAEDRGQVTVHAGRSRFTLAALPAEDFPVTDGGEMPHRFSLPAAALVRLVERVRAAISTEETRYYLNGIYLHAVEAEGEAPALLRAVSTDGHRLARFDLELPDGAADMPGVIVPRKAAFELSRQLGGASSEVGVEVSDTRIRFSFDDVVLTSKLIDGTFPDYQRVVPTGNDKELMIDSRLFAAAVDRVATVSTERSRGVKLNIRPGTVELSASHPDAGSASEELEANYDNSPVIIGFNSAYLLDFAGQMEGGEMRILLNEAGSPAVVRDPGNDAALYVLMPMRV